MSGRSEIRQRMFDQASLERYPLLAALSPRERDNLLEHASVERFLPGDLVIRQGEVGDRFYLIAEGRCEIFAHDNSKPASG